MSRLDETIQAKIQKRQSLEGQGITIHPYSFDKIDSVLQSRNKIGQQVTTAGRIKAIRTHGRVSFLDLEDSTAMIQVMIRQQEVGEDNFALLSNIDASDFLGVSGEVMTSKTGEITILASQFSFLGKALRPIPSQWNVADDKEVRFRKRFIDMQVNQKTKQILDTRWLIEKEIRRFLQDKYDFIEVETPILQALYGGTNAKPFHTHMNALDSDFYLRIAPELYLKRLIVGGYERIFEIARNFRNEGIDQTHQPEFTMIEWYQAYADYQTMMDTAEELIKHLVEKIYHHSMIMVGDQQIDVSGPWPRMTMSEALNHFAQIEFEKLSEEQIQQLLKTNQIELTGVYHPGKAMFALFDKLVTKSLIQPTWITDYPRAVSPLAKKHRLFPELAERFEGYIGGKELCDGWSEITDPLDQRKIFESEQQNMRSGDSEAHPLDEDFLEAMEYGMPPLGGIGMGIDRLVMFLTNTWSIKEVIAFPTLRPLTPLHIKSSVLEKDSLANVVEEGAKEDNFAAESKATISGDTPLPSRDEAENLLKQYVHNPALQHHCYMVAQAMAAYAAILGEDQELWYQTGLLHDLDWEMYPDEHPHKAVNELLSNYPGVLIQAIKAHAPGRTGKQPSTLIEKYLFACDEVSGLMHAVSLMRPNGFADMEVKSVKKKMKDKSFAANVSREDIVHGFELIGKTPEEHIGFLIKVFQT